MDNAYLSFFLVCFTAFFTIINPLGVMPVFMTMTADLTSVQRISTARKAVAVSFFTLLGFALTGEVLFDIGGEFPNCRGNNFFYGGVRYATSTPPTHQSTK